MPVKRQIGRSKSRRENERRVPVRDGKITASARGAPRELTRANKKMKAAASASQKFSANGAVRENGATKRAASAPVFRHSKTELEAAIQRYADLFEFAPIAYVSFDRVGRIEEINLSAAQLLGGSRARLIGKPFALHVMKEDRGPFLKHLLRCRSSDSRVETELRLKKQSGEIILAHLATSPMTSSMWDGALLYQTAILDLTGRKRAEQRLAEQARLLDLSNDAILVRDYAGRIIYWNRGATEIYGFTAEEALGEVTHKLLQTEHSEPLKRILQKLARDGRWSGEIVHTRKDGKRIVVMSRWALDRDAHGKQAHILETNTDITLRKQAEEAAQRLQETSTLLIRGGDVDALYQEILDTAIALMHSDMGSLQMFYPERGELQLLAWKGFAPKSAAFWKWVRPDSGSTCAIALSTRQRVIVTDVEACHFMAGTKDLDAYRRSGICAVQSTPLVSRSGSVVGMISTHWRKPHQPAERELDLFDVLGRQAADLIERKQSEEAIRASEGQFRSVFHQTISGIAETDLTGRFVLVNDRYCQIVGRSREELFKLRMQDIMHPEDLPANIKKFRALASGTGKNFFIEKRYLRPDGSSVWVHDDVSAIRDRENNVRHIVAVSIDITDRKNQEAALQKTKELLEELVQQRTKALGLANAELKNEIERRKGLEGDILAVSDREQQRLGQELHDGLCQHLTGVAFMARSVALRLKNHRVIEVSDIEKIAQLVNDAAGDTRDFSRALHRLDVDSAGLVGALQDLVNREIWKIPCRLDIKPSFHIKDDAAAAHLYRIAREAVINANKHSQAREIVVKLEGSRQGMVLRVIDDGVGLSNERKLKRGLGFHIMNYRAQIMGGRLEIDCPKRGGTYVSCYVPNSTLQSRKKENVQPARLPAKYHPMRFVRQISRSLLPLQPTLNHNRASP
jgi:PAS domain S-box-containing protein